MKKIDYEEYLDKTHGCWIGKCIGGTIGAPYEGAKELFNFEYNLNMIRNMIPNDDLDLQVLWLSVLEEKGIHFTSDDLADAFLNKCPYAPGEYAIFRKNYTRGIHPPTCGIYNNRYYIEGMGCPIRSEIWACIAPGNPVLAANLAEKDGILDHAGNSVFAEQFLAGLESSAFFEKDINCLVDIGLTLVPEGSKFARLVRDVREWCRKDHDWKTVRSRILRYYGHPDCTNMFQNMGFAVTALFFGCKDFIRTIMIALNSGFDTDCTCATSGAILGIIHGADFLMKKYGFEEQKYILGVDVKRKSDSVYDLAKDTCHMGVYFSKNQNNEIDIKNPPNHFEIKEVLSEPIRINVDYDCTASIGIGDQKTLYIHFHNHSSKPISGVACISIPIEWISNKNSEKLDISPGETKTMKIDITIPQNIKILHETNILEASFNLEDKKDVRYRFGLVGATVWEVFGPFWENHTNMPELKSGESYYSYIIGKDRDDSADKIRAYHLNTKVDMNKEYMNLDYILAQKCSDDPCKQGRMINFYEDLIMMKDAVGFQGPCAIYMVRRMLSPAKRKSTLLIGHTDAFRLWMNGHLIAKRDHVDWWTAENIHRHDVTIRKGENIIITKLCRNSEDVKFSLIFTKGGSCTEHYTDFASLNPQE